MMTSSIRSAPAPRLEKTGDGCEVLPSATGFYLAPGWENIPETLIINVIIALILICLFKILTLVAWSKVYENGIGEGLLSFLYGYRDPEKWYVIPRFEFLRRTDLHHDHDLNSQYIYVPPKLPHANPLELLGMEEISTRSLDDKSVTQSPKSSDPTRKDSFVKKSLHDVTKPKPPADDQTKVNSPVRPPESAPVGPLSASAATKTSGSMLSQAQQPAPKDALGSNFFYPSILTAEQLQASWLSRKLNRIFSIFFSVTDADMIYLKGIDAYEYLLFQRHLILIMLVINILCLGVILPINVVSRTSPPYEKTTSFIPRFQATTIKNVPTSSEFYWAHILCSVLIVVVSVIALNSYKSSIITKDEAQLARRTILIGNIPTEQRNRQKLTEVLRQHFASSVIEAIQFVYDTSKLEQYEAQLSTLVVAKNYCSYYKQKNNSEIMVKKTDVNEEQKCKGNCRLCSFIYVLCCEWPHETKQPGTEFYTKREEFYRKTISLHLQNLVKTPSEYAFVTFKSNKQTRRLMEKLANLKHEAIYGDSKPMNAPGQPESQIAKSTKTIRLNPTSKSEGSSSSRDLIRTIEPAPPVAAKVSSVKSQFLQHSGLKEHDPLDVRNNPHVRSIRIPIRKKVPGKDNQDAEAQPFDGSDLSTMDNQIGPLSWSVRYAPHPDNVEYRDLLNMSTTKNYTIVLLHLVMVIIFIFFTTPNVILSMVDKLIRLAQTDKDVPKSTNSTRFLSDRQGTFEAPRYESTFLNYLVILIQAITTSVLPSLITLISKQIPYEDSSSKSHSIMWKSYVFLVFMVVIMPSIGMTSAQALFSSDINYRCLFPSDNGAYFINYVVTQAFLSTMMELIKPTDIVFYTFILWTSRSCADFEGGRQFIEREFSVGMQHTAVLLIFSTVLTYSISCPLIAPFGLIYLIVKHAVDHYHLYNVYFTKKVDKNQQTTIMVFVRVALLLMLFQTTVSITINIGAGYFSFIMQIIFVLSLAVFCCKVFFFCTTPTAEERRPKKTRFQRDFCACFYLPRVMDDLLRLNALPESCLSRKV